MELNHLPGLENSLLVTAESLNKAQSVWLLGGSCGLLFQDVELDKEPRDIDIYADTETIPALHQELKSWTKDAPHLDKEGMYESVLSHYDIEHYAVELVGGFRISSQESIYQVQIKDLLYDYAPQKTIHQVPIRLMPLCHELVFNILRDRKDRYEAIAEAIRAQPEDHEELLKIIISQNVWRQSHLSLIQQLTHISL